MQATLVIGMTTKNADATIYYALKSILVQDLEGFKLYRVLIVDANSTDNTIEEAKRALEEHNADYEIIRKDTNVAQARNLIINIARELNAEYLYFHDADVILVHDNTLKLLRSITSRYKGALVGAKYNSLFFNTQDELINFSGKALSRMKKNRIDLDSIEIRKKLWIGFGSTLLIKPLIDVIRLSDDLSFAEDKQAGYLAWKNGYPVLLVEKKSGEPLAYDLNLRGLPSDLYYRLPIREYMRGIKEKILWGDVWDSFSPTLSEFALKLMKRYSKRFFHTLVDVLLVYSAVIEPHYLPLMLSVFVSSITYYAAKSRIRSPFRIFMQFAKFHLYSLLSIFLLPIVLYENLDELKEVYRKYEAFNDNL